MPTNSGAEQPEPPTNRERPYPTLSDRVDRIQHNLVLIFAASRHADADAERVLAAIHTAAEDALVLLAPLEDVPAEIANWHDGEDDGTGSEWGAGR